MSDSQPPGPPPGWGQNPGGTPPPGGGFPGPGPGGPPPGGPAWGQANPAGAGGNFGGGGPFGSAFAEASQAQMALILSISGAVLTLLLGWCCIIFSVIGLGLCGAGIFLSVQETNAIEAGRRDPSGAGQAKAALYIGIAGIVVFVGVIILTLAFFGLAAGTS